MCKQLVLLPATSDELEAAEMTITAFDSDYMLLQRPTSSDNQWWVSTARHGHLHIVVWQYLSVIDHAWSWQTGGLLTTLTSNIEHSRLEYRFIPITP